MVFQKLFESMEMGGFTLSNRMVMAPMTRARAGVERIPNDMMGQYYAQRADVGLIISEATSVSVQGLGWNQSPGMYTDAQEAGWKKVVEQVHQAGGRIFLQLWHCGRASHTDFHPELGLPVSASAIAIAGDHIHTPEGKKPYEVPRPLEVQEIPGVVEDYRQAAERARRAGFDGIEIHSANGYLLDQFLQDKTNHRSDGYGGSIENRTRLLREVVDGVLTVWPSQQVGVRISPNGGFNDMGDSNSRALFFAVAEQLNTRNLAYLHVMDGLGFGFHGNGEPILLQEFRSHYRGTLMGNVGYTAETAEAALQAGYCDLIAFGRPFITNPDLVQRFKHGHPLTPFDDMSRWYSHGTEGYIDYPSFEAQREHTAV